MSCDISQVFNSIIRTIRSTNGIRISSGDNNDDKTKSIDSQSLKTTTTVAAKTDTQNEFSFTNRARGLRSNLQILSGYLKRIHQLTAATIGNRSKQRIYADLTEQVANLIDQCTILLTQLHDVAAIDDLGFESKSNHHHKSQLNMHRLAVYKSLHEELGKLKKIRDVEMNRQRHLLELTGTLASGVKSLGPNNIKFGSTETSVRKRSIQSKPNQTGDGSGDRQIPDDETDLVSRKYEPEFSEAELQAFEMENSQLLSHLDREREDVHQVARSITEIGRLNQTISEHLVMQLEQTEQIANQTVSATENIRLANEQLREAINRQGSMKSCLLFILIVLTFSLHFLDWYYP